MMEEPPSNDKTEDSKHLVSKKNKDYFKIKLEQFTKKVMKQDIQYQDACS